MNSTELTIFLDVINQVSLGYEKMVLHETFLKVNLDS